jgi:hypothetical protein
MGRCFEESAYIWRRREDSPVPEEYIGVEVYDHRKNNPIINISIDAYRSDNADDENNDITIQLDLRDLLRILEQCDLTGFAPKDD